MNHTDKSETLCIIDDDKIHHFTIGKTIQLQGYFWKVLSFHDGVEAIDFFRENLSNTAILPDIIFLDLNMPVLDGWQFLQQYSLFKDQLAKEIKIYIVSSSMSESEISRATAIDEVSGFLRKPLKPEDFKDIFSNTSMN